ncbi:MAG: membrane protein insertase YidC [Flavobacteriales bacterium CG_4_9_14_3_um_filter_40_17]|nr:MAG: membrane protein insertase YidC [Flavobacteriales bacterium CG_4_9_14_3_um_filter_40_17]
MEEKKFDPNSLIGFLLIGGILMWMIYQNQPKPGELQSEEPTQVEQVKKTTSIEKRELANDSVKTFDFQGKYGAFGYGAALVSNPDETTVIENNLVFIRISNRGGKVVEARLKKFHSFDQKPVYLIKDDNADFDLTFSTYDNRVLHTKELVFEPELSHSGENQILSMKLKVSDNQYLEYRYELKPGDYMMGLTVRSQGLEKNLNSTQNPELLWKLKSYRYAKSVSYENRYSEMVFEYEGGKDDYLNAQKTLAEDTSKNVTWIAFKQHFFTTVLLTNQAFESAKLKSENLVVDEEIDTVFTKQFTATIPLKLRDGNLNYNMDLYFGPSDYKVLDKYNRNLDEIIPLGWGIFGWINRYVFIPFFNFLSDFFPHGLAIIIMTIVVRIVMSPVTYKSYLSQAKMKVLRPEITEINEKFKKEPMKRQQETMALYSKAGVNPMAGCIPALLQIPVFYALFSFFPSAFELRQKSFLWADDLSSYDTIAKLPFHVPFYGDHVSLFPILASVAIFFYMQMTTGQQMPQQPQQEGMPDMAKMMKIMMYISPVMMLFFFNNYASGLSLYYFISNLITILIMLVIKYYILDENKIHAQIQENKKNPKKMGAFQQKMRNMMEEAERQKKLKK